MAKRKRGLKKWTKAELAERGPSPEAVEHMEKLGLGIPKSVKLRSREEANNWCALCITGATDVEEALRILEAQEPPKDTEPPKEPEAPKDIEPPKEPETPEGDDPPKEPLKEEGGPAETV